MRCKLMCMLVSACQHARLRFCSSFYISSSCVMRFARVCFIEIQRTRKWDVAAASCDARLRMHITLSTQMHDITGSLAIGEQALQARMAKLDLIRTVFENKRWHSRACSRASGHEVFARRIESTGNRQGSGRLTLNFVVSS